MLAWAQPGPDTALPVLVAPNSRGHRSVRSAWSKARLRRALPGMLAAALVGVWALAVCAGLGFLLKYENRPGVSASPPARWPAGSGLERAAGRATLVMLVHPGCPCSRASVEELDRLMAGVGRLVTVHVLFFKPREFSDSWARTDLWEKAAAIPGVRVRQDDDGFEAGLFRAATSGQVVLYDAQGALLFSGGITSARGHAGDNEGREAIVALLTTNAAMTQARAPVFGCSLHEPDTLPTSE